MADRIVVLKDGRIEQVGTPIELYACPSNRFVAGFLGSPPMNMLAGTVEGNGVRLRSGSLVSLPERSIDLPAGAPVTVGIRPEHVEIKPGPMKASVTSTEMLGSETIVHTVLVGSEEPLTLALRGISWVQAGDTLEVAMPSPFVHLFDESGTTIGANEDWRRAYLP